MRQFVIALLVLVLAGGHSAAALGAGLPEGAETGHASVMHHEQVTGQSDLSMSLMICCKEAETHSADGQAAGCNGDCPSFVADGLEYSFLTTHDREDAASKVLSAFAPPPEDHPPRHI